MKNVNKLIESLEKLTNKKVTLKEGVEKKYTYSIYFDKEELSRFLKLITKLKLNPNEFKTEITGPGKSSIKASISAPESIEPVLLQLETLAHNNFGASWVWKTGGKGRKERLRSEEYGFKIIKPFYFNVETGETAESKYEFGAASELRGMDILFFKPGRENMALDVFDSAEALSEVDGIEQFVVFS